MHDWETLGFSDSKDSDPQQCRQVFKRQLGLVKRKWLVLSGHISSKVSADHLKLASYFLTYIHLVSVRVPWFILFHRSHLSYLSAMALAVVTVHSVQL